jgi:predicted ATPase
LEINNFKCFSSLRLPFGKLTLLTGFNGGGKSTATQPLLLLAQTSRRSLAAGFPALNGELVRLGTVADVVPVHSSSTSVAFTIRTDDAQDEWLFEVRAGERFLRPVHRIESLGAPEDPLNSNLADLVYLSAVREGTADTFPIPDADGEGFFNIGVDGRYAAYWYNRIVDEPVPENRLHPEEAGNSVRKQLDAWLSTLFPGAQANVQALPNVALLSLQFRLSAIGDWRRPANVGYGLTYVFPILVTLLAARPGQTVIIDSPEAHLHPSAQSDMGKLLAHFAGAGIQIIVETHSDHLLNGARLAVRDSIINSEELMIHFFTRADEDGHGVISPAIDSEGRISEWPEGFFDQTEKDLARLAGWE